MSRSVSQSARQALSNPASRDVFGAIADASRRRILTALGAARAQEGGEKTMTEIAGLFDVTLSAVSQHLRVLLEADLVTVRRVGRERRYRLNAAPLKEVSAWVQEYETFWDDKITALGAYLDETVGEDDGRQEASEPTERPRHPQPP